MIHKHLALESSTRYTFEQFKLLDNSQKATYTAYLTNLYQTDKQSLKTIIQSTGFLTLDNSQIESLDLTPFQGITDLNLDKYNLQSLEHIQQLTQLHSLSLHGCQNLQSIEHIKQLTQLKSLHLQGCENLQSLEGII